MKYLQRYSVLLHILGWSVFICTPFLVFPFSEFSEEPYFKRMIFIKLFENGLFILFFYLNLQRYTPTLLTTKKALPFIAAFLVGFFICLLVPDFLLRSFVFNGHGFIPKPPTHFRGVQPPPPSSFFIPIPRIIATFLSFSFVSLVSSMLALVRDRLREQEEKQQIQLEKVAAELAVLKLQISPHFLFNTLNNLRWLTRQKSDKAEEIVVKLSQLLRYMIYEAEAEKVPLIKEINHLEHYIDLQKIRLTSKDEVLLIYEGEIDSLIIEPLLFIPFVENAFKYGLHSTNKSQIIFKIIVQNKQLTFTAQNPIFENNLPPEGQSGIGIQNVRQRLALHYPDTHDLQIKQENGIFKVTLHLVLQP